MSIVALMLSAGVNAEIEEVIVTAQKRAQSLQDVPMAVSAVTGMALSDAGVDTTLDLTRIVPTLDMQTNTSPVSTNFRIRRIGNFGNIPDFEPAVGVFIDGAYRSRPLFGANELFDLDRVEILRGPQSTLYGKNVTAGVIGIYTALPAEEFEWRAELRSGIVQGSRDATAYSFKGGITGPLADNLAGSLGVSYTFQDEMQEQAISGAPDANELERYSVRGQLHWNPSDDLSVRAILGMMRQPDNKRLANDFYFDPNGPFAGIILPVWQGAGVSEVCTDTDPDNRIGCNRLPMESDVEANEATLLISYTLDNGMVIDSVTSYDDYRFEGLQPDVAQVMAPIFRYQDTQEGEAWQQELRLSGSNDTLDWMTGVFIYQSTFNRGDKGKRPMMLWDTLSDHPAVVGLHGALFGIPLPFATQGQMGFIDSEIDTDYRAVFGQMTWHISDQFNLTAGARWQEEDKEGHLRQSVNDPSPSIISFLLSPSWISSDNLERDTDEVTWSVTPQYTFNNGTMIYGNVSKGFKSGGFNTGFGDITIPNREFQDEDIRHVEVGIKSDLMDGRLRLAGSVFQTQYDDYQDSAFVGGQFTVGNAEELELRGFEVEGTALVGDNLTVDFAVSYADLEYDRHTTAQCYPGRTPDSPTDPAGCVLDGEKPINAPEWKAHLGVTYEVPVSWGDVYARGGWSWTDEYNTSFSADPLLVQDSHHWLSARLGFRWSDVELVLWGENLADEEVNTLTAVTNIYAGGGDNSYQNYQLPPRSYGITIRMNF